MLRLAWLAVFIAILWTGWWAIAAFGLRSGADVWLQERRVEGWQAEATELDVKGYPARFSLTLSDPALADPDTGVAFSTEALLLSSPAWWPGHVTVTLPGETFDVATPLERFTVSAENALSDLRLRPGTALELEHASVTSGMWQVGSGNGTLSSANGLTLSMQQAEENPVAYRIEANAPAFTPGSVIRRALRVPQNWPIAFDSLTVAGTVTLDRPIDRTTVEKNRPQPRVIDLELAEAVWGDVLVRATANLTVSDQGLIDGQMNFQARNWQDLLTLAETAGLLPAAIKPQVDNILSALARGSGNPDAIDLTLQARGGAIFMGFVPLGQLPPLVLR